MRRAFTLVELLIAVGLLVFVGMSVAWMLSGAMRTWQRGSRLFRVQIKARRIFNYLTKDLAMVHAGPVEQFGRTVTPSFLCDFDPAFNTQRLRLIRAYPIEEGPLPQEAGNLLKARGRIDGVNDALEALRGDLLPTGGLCEVAWIHTGSASKQPFRLYRAMQSPPGGSRSLFGKAVSLDERFCEVADGILIFGLQFWSIVTKRWEQAMPRWNTPKSGPLLWWDSTLSTRDPFELDKDAYRLADRPDSADNPEDDVYPLCMRVVLVMAEYGDGVVCRLSHGMTAESKSMVVDNPDRLRGRRYLLVDNEIMELKSVSGSRVLLKGRGLFGSQPQSHRRGASVRTGPHFVRVIPLLCGIEDWNPPK